MESINHHNYEDWLMLYLDNELTAPERKAVEVFMDANPDLQEEMNGLKEVILPKEILEPMPGKERLLMPGIWNEARLTSQQEQLLMLADKALSEKEKASLEKEILKSPLLQKEWELLKCAIIAETIPEEMPGKEKLYRHQSIKVIPWSRVYRIAAAAAVIAFGWFFALKMQQGNVPTDNIEVVIENPTPSFSQENLQPSNINAAKSPKALIDLATIPNKEQPATMETSLTKVQVIKVNEHIEKIMGEEEYLNKEPNETFKKQRVEMVNNVATIAETKEIAIAGVEAILPINSIPQAEIASNTNMPDKNSSAIFETVDEEAFEEDDAINIAGARISKQRLRGFYRNFTRPLAKTFDKNSRKTYETK